MFGLCNSAHPTNRVNGDKAGHARLDVELCKTAKGRLRVRPGRKAPVDCLLRLWPHLPERKRAVPRGAIRSKGGTRKASQKSPREYPILRIVGRGPRYPFEERKVTGSEGLIGKRKNSLYQKGKRRGSWIKLKINNEQEFVIGGFTEPKGGRTFLVHSLWDILNEGNSYSPEKSAPGSRMHRLKQFTGK